MLHLTTRSSDDRPPQAVLHLLEHELRLLAEGRRVLAGRGIERRQAGDEDEAAAPTGDALRALE
jgi:hypothetical protein